MERTEIINFTQEEFQLKNYKNLNEIKKREAEDVSKDLTAVFFSKMLNIMFDTVETDPIFGGGSPEKIYQSMMCDEYAKNISKTDNSGLSDAVLKSILRYQEV